MTDEQITEARAVIADDKTVPASWINTRHFADAARNRTNGWGAALDEIERLTARVAEMEAELAQWKRTAAAYRAGTYTR